VRHALRIGDTGQQADLLSQQLLAACNLQRPDQLIDHFYANPERRYWAGQAKVVFDLASAGDTVARRIVDQAAADLAVLVRTVNSALGESGRNLPVVLGGGVLVHQPLLQDAVRQALVADGLTDLRPLDRDPAHGALFLAKQLTAASVSETDPPVPLTRRSPAHSIQSWA